MMVADPEFRHSRDPQRVESSFVPARREGHATMTKKIRTIAVVDDDNEIRRALSSLIRSLGYSVRTYASAAEFLGDTRAAIRIA